MSKIIVLYDGHCNLCHFFLQLIMKGDSKSTFQYLSLQSVEAKALILKRFGDIKIPDSVILIEECVMFTKSAVFFKILPYLDRRYRILIVFKVLPRTLSDRIYDWIAANRYTWFGKKEYCDR